MLAEPETLGTGPTPGQPHMAEQAISQECNLVGARTTSEAYSRRRGAHLKADNAATEAFNPTPETEQPPRAATVTLETLPAELRLQILKLLPELTDLKAIVHASPVFHQQYLLDRRQLLGNSLQVNLGSVLVDAYALEQSLALPEARQLPLGATTRFVRLQLADYAELRASPHGVLEKCSSDALASMASFYLSVIKPLLAQLPPLFLQNLNGPPEADVEELSKVERTRLSRALYRVQLFYSLFRFDEECSPAGFQFSGADKIISFFGLFDPWENEAVYSIYHAMVEKYRRLFEETPWDLGKLHETMPCAEREPLALEKGTPPPNYPLFLGWPVLLCRCWKVDKLTPPPRYTDARQKLREGAIANGGLGLFRKALEAPGPEELARLMEDNLSWCTVQSIGLLMSLLVLDYARNIAPSERDEAEYRGDELLFDGDKEDGPPLGWVTLWRGVYGNEYGQMLPRPLQEFGYVFWDAERLVKSGGEARIRVHM